MKSTHNRTVTKEDTKKMSTVGNTTHPATNYTKDDFLTPALVAKKFNISTDEALNLMKKINFKKAVFALNGHRTPMVIRFSNNSTLHLHPMAIPAFQEYIDKQKAK